MKTAGPKSLVVLLLMSFIVSGIFMTGCKKSVNPQKKSMISPMIDQNGADPFLFFDGETYLYTKTTGTNIMLARSESLLTVGGAEAKVIYEPGSKLSDLWAPEIWRLDGVWYVYFAARTPGEKLHFMYVLSNPSKDPLKGEWMCEPLKGMDDKFAIDGTVLELGEKRYFLWSGWETYENIQQDIYIAEMICPTEVKKEKILLSKPEYPWEKVGNPLINEGPEVLVDEKKVNLVYSASGSWTDSYCLGLLTMEKDKDPLVPENWEKHTKPILSKIGDVYGPGHHCFTLSKDGSQTLIVYHAARWKGSGWERSIRYDYVLRDESGSVKKITPVSGDGQIAIPSGEKQPKRYTPDVFETVGGAEIKQHGKETVAEGFLTRKDKIVLRWDEEKARDAYVVVFVKTKDLRSGIVGGLELNHEKQAVYGPIYGAENYQPVFFPLHLKKGTNEVTVGSDTGGALLYISHIEIR